MPTPNRHESPIRSLGQVTPDCDALDVCGASKFACVAQSGGAATDKLADSFGVMNDRLGTELKKYDDKNLTEWDFSPIAPLVKCP